MVDGVVLLVDASEGPLPQTRFVLRKALEAQLPVVLVVNKVDRPDARIEEVVDEVYELFLDLDADEHADRVPDRLHQRARRAGRSSRTSSRDDLEPLFETLLETVPPPSYDRGPPAAGARHEPRRLAVRRPARALPHPQRHAPQGRDGRVVPRRRHDRAPRRSTELYVTEALDRVPADEAGPGEIIALAGIPEVTIGETIADPDDPRPLPVTSVDEPRSR